MRSKFYECGLIMNSMFFYLILKHQLPAKKRRTPPNCILGKGKTLGDIVSPIVNAEEWECLK
ncbi:MAG: hypothetical protein AN490_19550 [Anabaena sp. AL09]|nr:MAG: hypothetical protein AN490_19550 [Anabaena sp. AL09]OBQ03680.1 MAG: hypothetical protein AN482_19330 [Anabaena sp. LE011-02]OBQ34860.1 MAG: hypothetical protein AN485_15000 [Anabaena sp. MDT14b]